MSRKISKAVDLQAAFKGLPQIPYLSETKEFLRQHPELSYAIPAFVDGDSSVIVMRFQTKKSNDLMTLINPTYLSVSGLILSEETQYGVEGVYLVPRHPKIEFMFTKLPEGIASKSVLVGKSALMFQQALEALNGKYIDDFGVRIDNNETYQNATDEEKAEYGKAYMDALSDLLKEMEEDPKVREYEKATDFLTEKIAVGVEADKIIEEARKNEQENAKGPNDNETVRESVKNSEGDGA